MLDVPATLPDDPDDLRSLAERPIAEVKAQAMLIEKLRHQIAGHQAWRYGASSEASAQLQLALETSELAAAAMAAQMGLPARPRPRAAWARWRSPRPATAAAHAAARPGRSAKT